MIARSASLFVLVSFLTLASGCFRYGVNTNVPTDGVERMQRGPVFAWGLAGQSKLAEECPNGVARSESFMPWWGGLVAAVTIGIVTPWRVEYVCAAGPGVQVVPSGAPAPSMDGL